MTVEQTNQLIQLTLNSVLMIVACGMVLTGVLRRYRAIAEQLQAVTREYFDLAEPGERWQGDRLLFLKSQIRQLRQSYKMTQVSVQTTYSALALLVASTLSMSLRTLVGLDWLIHLSLALFVIGVGILLLGVGVALFDSYIASRPLWDEVNWVLNLGDARSLPALPSGKPRTSRKPRKVPRRAVPSSQPSRNVGVI